MAAKTQNIESLELTKKVQMEMEVREGSIVHPALEVLDPTPNIHDLFCQFDTKFFFSKLGSVIVGWSSRMTSCAGICYSFPRTGVCYIRLSKPLLSLRPRKNLVETLLHEMIHAYLFITKSGNNREEHGPEFHKHMFRINKEAGTNITVYHSFINEVRHYQTHVWRCNGICQNKPPYYGIVRRSKNRAPSATDFWWARHSKSCGGNFIKISAPENQPKKNIGNNLPVVKIQDIRDAFKRITTLKDINSNSSGNSSQSLDWSTGNKKIVTLKDLKYSEKLSDSNTKTVVKVTTSNPESSDGARKRVRDVWAEKYPESAKKFKKSMLLSECPRCGDFFENIADHDVECRNKISKCPVCWKEMAQSEVEGHLESCLSFDFFDDFDSDNIVSVGDEWEKDWKDIDENLQVCPCCAKSFSAEVMSSHIDECLNVFNDDTDDFSQPTANVPCPCCNKLIPEANITSHVDECLNLCAIKEGLFND